jgi:hypothetical protein
MIDLFKNIRHLTETDDDILFFVNAIIEQYQNDVPLLTKHINDNNFVELKKTSHKLKSTFKHLDIQPITEFICELDENNQPNSTTEFLRYFYNKFMAELPEFMEAVYFEKSKVENK